MEQRRQQITTKEIIFTKMAQDDRFAFPSVMKWIISILAIVGVVYGIWYFRFIVGCIFIALILSLVGRPIMKFLGKIHYKKFHPSKGLCAGITLVSELLIIFLVFYLLIPVIVSQAMSFAEIDLEKLSAYYAGPIQSIQEFVTKYNLIPDGVSLESYINDSLMNVFKSLNFSAIISTIISLGSNIVMGIFITVFVTFFFLKDAHIVSSFVDNITPDKYLEEVHHIISNSRSLISRYFIGIFCEILCMIILLSIGFYIVGFNNAILIAGICGVMVILPYIGVFIGGGLGLMFLITDFLAHNPGGDILPIILQFVLIFMIVKLIDDFVLQPMIYSKSVKAKPLEIFLVILMAGEIGGVLGMVLGIPVYTFLRIIAKEFFNKWKFIKALTKEIG